MGDAADYTLESIDYSQYNGCADGGSWETPRSAGVTCRCCGRTGLKWGERNGKWRLFDMRGVHACPENPLAELQPPEQTH